MYWTKGLCVLLLLMIGLSGCALTVATLEALATPDPNEGPVYLEQIDNDEFLDFVLEDNIIEGLKREDVIYVDNIFGDNVYFGSSKAILTKDAFYEVRTDQVGMWPNYKVDIERLREIYQKWKKQKFLYHWAMQIYKRYYVTPEYITMAEIDSGDSFSNGFCKNSYVYKSCERLKVIKEARGDIKWYQSRQWTLFENIYSRRYNDIHKIKAVIEERVAYFLSLENNQTNATSADQ